MWNICRGEPQNLANWPAEFGKICRGKLWSLIIIIIIIIMYLTALAKPESLFLTRDTTDDGHSSDTKITAKLDRFLLNLLRKLSRRRKNYGVWTQLCIFKPSPPQQAFSHWFDIWYLTTNNSETYREYLRNATRYRQPKNGSINCDNFCTCVPNLVNFGPQTEKNRTEFWQPKSQLFGMFISPVIHGDSWKFNTD